MERLKFSSTIKAPKEKVWQTLWNMDTYSEWTSAFCEGSVAKTDNWKVDSKVLFLDGKGSGMVSKVVANRPNDFMSFEHLGEVKEGVEDTSSDKVKAWAGAIESYTLTEENGKTKLDIELDIVEDFKDYMLNTWPKALENLKEIAENKN